MGGNTNMVLHSKRKDIGRAGRIKAMTPYVEKMIRTKKIKRGRAYKRKLYNKRFKSSIMYKFNHQ